MTWPNICRVPCRRGTQQSSNLCHVPWFLHTAKIDTFAVCHSFCTRQRFQIQFCLFVDYVYGTPSISYIYNKHFMYPKKHRRHLIYHNKHITIKSCFVHGQPQVLVKSVHISSYKSIWQSPYKFNCKGSIYVSRNEVHTTHGADGGGGGGCCGHIGGDGHVGVCDQPCCGGGGGWCCCCR